ncbi:MAG: FtsW/RodA/SpoVE family cell cycle protein [Clostridia bacterium]|nr:FtsW/RodA/SpoVE family cell cycle protein [Clostridia bacterium]
MNAKEFLNNVSKEIKYKPANKSITEELEAHIEDLKNDNLCKGYTDKQAEEKAVEQMGNAKKIGKKLNKIHRPKLDWITLFFSLAFIYFGGQFWSFSYLESYWNNGNNLSDWYVYYRLVCIELIVGLIFSIFLFFYDYRKICKHSKTLFILATILNVIAYLKGFRANGNLVYGLWPFTSTSPAVFTVPLYIIAFAGFIKDIEEESKISIDTSYKKTFNYNIVKIIVLSCLAVISSLMINFVSGFCVAMVYLIILTSGLLKSKQIKKTFMIILATSLGFVLLSTIICIVPTRVMHRRDKYTSAYWVGVDTVGERRIDFVRKEIFKAAKLLGQADLEGISLSDEQGYHSNIQNWFGTRGKFAFLGILSEYGWIASFGLILIVIAFDIKLILSARKITDSYGKLIVNGITSLFIVQTICNLAMNFGIIGTAEFQLPLISGGKATFIANLLCVALFLSVYRRKDINFEEPKKSKLASKIEDFFFQEV